MYDVKYLVVTLEITESSLGLGVYHLPAEKTEQNQARVQGKEVQPELAKRGQGRISLRI